MTDAAAPAAGGRGLRLLLLLPLAIFLLLAALFARQLGAGDPSRLPSALIGKPAPAVALPPLDGQRDASGQPLPGLASGDLENGGVTVVNVWASWCAPCRIEHPVLMQLAAEPGVRVVGINYKDKPDAARRFLQTLGNPFKAVGIDESGRAGIDWGVYGVPETFIVSGDGVIRHKLVGPLSPEALPEFLQQVRAARRAK